MEYDVEPWSWIPHVEGADRQKEINAYLKKMVDEMPIAQYKHVGHEPSWWKPFLRRLRAWKTT